MWVTHPQSQIPILKRIGNQQHGARYFLSKIVIITALVLVIPGLCFAKDEEENAALSRVDGLIAEKRYGEALNILIPFMRENDKFFDAAQKRVQKILSVKELFNTLVKELLNELEKEEPDPERIVEMRNNLLDLDPEREGEVIALINRVAEVALFKSNMKRLDRILNEGQALADQGRYAEAIRTYSGGLDIYQREFFVSGYGTAMENRVRQGITNINTNITPVTAAANALQEAVNALAALSGQSIEEQNLASYRNAYNRLSAEMDRFTALRDNFSNTNDAFRQDLTQLRGNFPEQGDRNFLAFAVRLMQGRSESSGGGILGVFDSIWNKEIPRARDLLDQKSQTVYAAIVNDASSKEYGRITARSDILAGYGSFPADLEIRWGRYEKRQKETIFTQPVSAGEAGNYLKFRYLSESNVYWRTLGQLGSRFNVVPVQDSVALWREGRNGEELIRAELSSVAVLRQIRTDAQTLLTAIQREGAEYRTLETRYPNSGSMTYMNGVISAAEDLLNLVAVSEESALIRRYTIANGLLEERLAAREAAFAESSSLFQGTQQGSYLAKSPTRAAELLGRMDTALETDRQTLEALLSQYNAESPAISGNSQIRSLREEAAATLSRLDNVRSQGRSMAVTARSQSADAANLRQNGNRYFSEAQAAFARNDFETSLRLIEQAITALDQSLEREYDEAAWNRRNTAIPDLNKTVNAAYNQDNQRQVAELLVQIENDFYASNIGQAEQKIIRAKVIWARTNPDAENGELVYWASMIDAGSRSARTIPPTAPLYAEMSQLLSDARKNFDEGAVLISSTRTEAEAKRKLNGAKASLAKVKLVYPMNEEAGILGLRIDSLLVPDSREALNNKINSIITRTRQDSMSSRREALIELRNYAAVFPDARIWGPIINQAEIDAGLKPRPATPEERAEAQQIAVRARTELASGNVERIKVIQAELVRAGTLDRENQEVRRLLEESYRRLRIILTVLDTPAERLYQQAYQALAQQDIIRCRQYLNQIYSMNPDYREVPKVKSLQQRVDAL